MSPSPDTIIVTYETTLKMLAVIVVGAAILVAGLRWILKRFW